MAGDRDMSYSLWNLSFFFQVDLLLFLLLLKSKKRRFCVVASIVSTAVFAVVSGYLPYAGLFYGFTYVYVVMFAFCLITGLLTRDIPLKVLLSYAFTALILQNLVNNFCRLILMPYINEGYHLYFLLIDNLVYLVIVAAAYFTFIRRINDLELHLSVVKLALVCVFAFFIVFFATNYMLDVIEGSVGEVFGLLIIIIADVGLLCIEFSVFEISKGENEKRILDMMLALSEERVNMQKDTIDEINKKCHDIKHQLVALRREGISAEHERYLDELDTTVSIYDKNARLGNRYLDIIFTEKKFVCEQKNIRFQYMLDGKAFDFLSSVEICSLFGNAIDNAIDASLKVGDLEKRFIIVNSFVRNKFLFLTFENYFDHDIVFENDIPVTTKENNGYHGYGIKSIKYIVSAHGGVTNIRLEDNLYKLSILFPLSSRRLSSADE